MRCPPGIGWSFLAALIFSVTAYAMPSAQASPEGCGFCDVDCNSVEYAAALCMRECGGSDTYVYCDEEKCDAEETWNWCFRPIIE
jgi:hypothetical protein